MVLLDHPEPHLPVQGLSFRDKGSLATAFARSLEPMAFAGSPHDLRMRCPHRIFGDFGGFLAASLANVGGSTKQRLRQQVEHRRMHAILDCPFRHSVLALHEVQHNAGFDHRLMVPALFNVLISSLLEISRLQIVASVTIRFWGSNLIRIRRFPHGRKRDQRRPTGLSRACLQVDVRDAGAVSYSRR